MQAVTRDELLQRISIDPNICFGKPCIKGHRIWVSLVLDLLASGWSFQQVLDNYPGLTEDDIRACIAYGAGSPSCGCLPGRPMKTSSTPAAR